MRVGMGYDVHKLVKDRKLIMGGVEIPYELGLLGHSDADVLLHAIMDALLGAAALGDIGKHFPDTDDRYKGISSIKLLEEVGKKIDEANYIIENIDATIIAQKPKMRPYIDDMRKNIADALKLDVDRVNVKATTEEGTGLLGVGTPHIPIDTAVAGFEQRHYGLRHVHPSPRLRIVQLRGIVPIRPGKYRHGRFGLFHRPYPPRRPEGIAPQRHCLSSLPDGPQGVGSRRKVDR